MEATAQVVKNRLSIKFKIDNRKVTQIFNIGGTFPIMQLIPVEAHMKKKSKPNKLEKLTNQELLDKTYIYKSICQFVPTKKRDDDMFTLLLNECDRRKLIK